MDISVLLTLLLVHQLGLMLPGPDFVVVVDSSLLSSRRAGLFTALGIMSGLAVHLAYTFAGLALVISRSILLFSVIKYAGAAYLVWIGIKGLRARKASQQENMQSSSTPSGNRTAWAAYKKGLLTNVLNPKVTLFFLSVFSQFITPETGLGTRLVYVSALLAQNLAWFSVVATLFSAPVLRTRLHAVRHYLDRTMGAVLVALGLRVALSDR